MLLMTNHVKAAIAIYKNTAFAVADRPEGRHLILILTL